MAKSSPRELSLKDFRFEIKEVSEEGTFTGYASMYGVTDLGGDLVEKGAFTRTIKAHPSVPILWQHNAPIGLGQLEDSERGLIIKGRLTLEVAAAREALALVKAGVVRGLSIGFQAVKDSVREGIRYLQEVKLWEVSLVTFPMLPSAQVTSVKKVPDMMERKMDFNEALDNIETMRGMYTSLDALQSAVYDCLYDEDMTNADCIAMVQQSIEQFSEKITAVIPKIRALMNAEYGYSFKRLLEIEKKAGRKISAANRSKIEDAITQLQALLEEASSESEESGLSTSPETKAGGSPGPAVTPPDPDPLHSALITKLNDLKGAITWNSTNN